MATDADPRTRLLEYLALLAPGTPLREGLERILRGRTGALVVLGRSPEVQRLSTGGFELEVPYSATALRELAKMDGAILIDLVTDRIVRAGVQLMPSAAIETMETGTRHRTADRVARQTGVPVVSVSASMSTIALYLDGARHLVEHSEQLLSRANQAMQTLERYRDRLAQVTNRLSSLEVQDQVTVGDFVLVAQRLEMVRRLDAELSGYLIELGTDGRLLELQQQDLASGEDRLVPLLEQDYRPDDPEAPFGLRHLTELSTAELLDPATVARTLGFPPSAAPDSRIPTRGYRQVAQINRLPASLGVRLLEHFGSLQALFGASASDLQEVEGVGEQRARVIRDGLARLAELAYSERLD